MSIVELINSGLFIVLSVAIIMVIRPLSRTWSERVAHDCKISFTAKEIKLILSLMIGIAFLLVRFDTDGMRIVNFIKAALLGGI